MKRLPAWLAFAIVLSSVAYAQSLADVARETRKTEGQRKKAARVYTNDDIPSVVFAPPAADAAKADTPDAAKPSDAAKPAPGAEKKADTKDGDTEADVQKMNERYKAQVEQQKAAVNLLEREISVLEHENQIQASAYYRDAGTRLKDGKNWVEERTKRDTDIAERKALLEKAKEQLAATEEEARKAGVPSNAIQ